MYTHLYYYIEIYCVTGESVSGYMLFMFIAKSTRYGEIRRSLIADVVFPIQKNIELVIFLSKETEKLYIMVTKDCQIIKKTKYLIKG